MATVLAHPQQCLETFWSDPHFLETSLESREGNVSFRDTIHFTWHFKVSPVILFLVQVTKFKKYKSWNPKAQ